MKDSENGYKPITLLDITEDSKKRLASITKEFSRGFEFIKNYPKSITVFGSARTKEGDEYYEKARELGKKVVENLRYSIITGGGPGIMEAANRGAFEAGGNSLGLNIELPHEQINNPYLTDSIEFHYFFSRKVCMSFSAEAYVFFPGGYGTLDEFMEILTLVQTNKITPIPIVLFGKEYWEEIEDFFKKTLIDGEMIDKVDTSLYTITDDIEKIIEIVKTAPVQISNKYEEHSSEKAVGPKYSAREDGPITGLIERHCVPCEGGEAPLSHEESTKLLKEVSQWTLLEDKEIEKTYEFKNFAEAMDFLNEVGEIAEKEGHHPDIKIHDYKKVTVKISTHAINGLSENDFIIAAKIDDLVRK